IRSLLPAVPAVGILIGRRIDDRQLAWLNTVPNTLLKFAVPALLIAMFVAWGDYRLAGSQKRAAMTLADRYLDASDPLWFEGHWGFQYYMQLLNARSVNYADAKLLPAQIVIIPIENSNLYRFPSSVVEVVETLGFQAGTMISTMNTPMAINFHMSQPGVLMPF